MFYIQTVIEITESDMTSMVADVLDCLGDTAEGYNYPSTKEVKVAILKEALKKVLENA